MSLEAQTGSTALPAASVRSTVLLPAGVRAAQSTGDPFPRLQEKARDRGADTLLGCCTAGSRTVPPCKSFWTQHGSLVAPLWWSGGSRVSGKRHFWSTPLNMRLAYGCFGGPVSSRR